MPEAALDETRYGDDPSCFGDLRALLAAVDEPTAVEPFGHGLQRLLASLARARDRA